LTAIKDLRVVSSKLADGNANILFADKQNNTEQAIAFTNGVFKVWVLFVMKYSYCTCVCTKGISINESSKALLPFNFILRNFVIALIQLKLA